MKAAKLLVMMLFFSFVFLPCDSVYSFNGYIETNALYYPHKGDIFESRNRLLLEEKEDSKDWVTLYISGRADVLLSNRDEENNEIIGNIDDASITFFCTKGEVKIGYSKVFWGKLDQLAPTDIINPLDISQLFLKNERKEAKLSVPLFMLSPYFGEQSRLDLILVPIFKEGTYDELKERSSPFNIEQFPSPFDKLNVKQQLPSKDMENIEYGGRVSSTLREIDFSVYYFKGFYDFPMYKLTYRFDPILSEFIPDTIRAEYLKYTMLGYDFEFVKGKWGIRGEGAFFSDYGFQKEGILDYAKGNYFIGGFGVDRSFGGNYFNFSALYRKIFIDDALEERKREITLLGNIERQFSYETKEIKLFSIYNTMSDSIFIKGTFRSMLLEGLWIDVSVGIFEGKEKDTLSKFEESDFFLITCKYNF